MQCCNADALLPIAGAWMAHSDPADRSGDAYILSADALFPRIRAVAAGNWAQGGLLLPSHALPASASQRHVDVIAHILQGTL